MPIIVELDGNSIAVIIEGDEPRREALTRREALRLIKVLLIALDEMDPPLEPETAFRPEQQSLEVQYFQAEIDETKQEQKKRELGS